MAKIDPSSLKGMDVVEVGYPNDISGNDPKTMKLSEQKCKVLGYDGSTTNFQLSCRTNFGGSGSMIFAAGPDGKEYVIAVASSGNPVYDKSGKLQGYVTTHLQLAYRSLY